MKFGKNLTTQIEETLPEWRDKFLSYKDLKKLLKLIQPKSPAPDPADDRPAKRPRLASVDSAAEDDISKEESDFIELLEAEVEKFNAFFVEKEEEYIIRLKDLQERVAKAKEESEEMRRIRKENVDFHGEMVLLENYSALNYTGIVKILKKYDKRTGRVLRLPFIQKVLHQPFYTTDVLNKLVKACEAMLDRLFPANQQPLPATAAGVEEESKESLYMKSTMSALRALGRIRSGSSTVSVFSLPPLQLGSIVLEQQVAE